MGPAPHPRPVYTPIILERTSAGMREEHFWSPVGNHCSKSVRVCVSVCVRI